MSFKSLLRRILFSKKKSSFSVSSDPRRFVAVSQKFASVHGHKLFSLYKGIKKNFSILLKGKPINLSGYTVVCDSVGSYKGAANRVRLRVEDSQGRFFVKFGSHAGVGELNAYSITRDYFSSIGNKFKRFNVFVIPIHLMYARSNFRVPSQKNIEFGGVVVSNFVPSSFIHVKDLSISEYDAVKPVIDSLRLKLYKKGVFDAGELNAFYDQNSKSIAFFDLTAQDWSS